MTRHADDLPRVSLDSSTEAPPLVVQALAALIRSRPRRRVEEVPPWLDALQPPNDLAAIARAEAGRPTAVLGAWEISLAAADDLLVATGVSAPAERCVYLADDGGGLSLLAAWSPAARDTELYLVLPEDGMLQPVGRIEDWLCDLLDGQDVPPGSTGDHLTRYPGMLAELREHLDRLVAEARRRVGEIEEALEREVGQTDDLYEEWERLEALVGAAGSC